jgi:hypothetical protein
MFDFDIVLLVVKNIIDWSKSDSIDLLDLERQEQITSLYKAYPTLPTFLLGPQFIFLTISISLAEEEWCVSFLSINFRWHCAKHELINFLDTKDKMLL